MAGLSILLESQNKNSNSKCLQVINKIAKSKPCSSWFPLISHTLGTCFLCRKPLSPKKDVYMYKGDRAFCSVECRYKQISMDEKGLNEDSVGVNGANKPYFSSE